MSWLHETALRDLDEKARLEATCPACGHSWVVEPTHLLIQVDHRDVKLDEVADNLSCRRRTCRRVGVRLMLHSTDETSGFVGGMP